MDIDALAEKVNQLERRFEALESKRTNDNREIYRRLRDIEIENGKTDERYKHILNELNEQKGQLVGIMDQLTAISEKPAKRWESVVSNIISTFVGAVVGILTGRMFK